MERGTTFFLKAAVCAMGIAVLALCAYLIPTVLIQQDVGGYRAILLGLYLPAVPFYIALYQTLKLLGAIDKNLAFSDASVAALGRIKVCAIAISALFAAGMPYIYVVADRDDAPGVILIGLVIIAASTVIAVFAAMLQRLLRDAIAIQAENELTV